MKKASDMKGVSKHHGALEKLKTRGLRVTHPRKKLIETILSQEGHWTIQELMIKLNRSSERFGQATVYRTIHLLQSEGYLTETRLGLDSARYEVSDHAHHDHLTCLTCGKIVEFENPMIEKLQERVAADLGFRLTDHRMELFGHCISGCEKNVTLRQVSGAAVRKAAHTARKKTK